MRLLAAPAALIALFAFVACGDDEGEDTTVEVTLTEFAIEASQTSAPPGDITFELDNDGPDLQHELRVIRTDFDPADLPTNDDGRADLGAAGVNEVRGFAPVDEGRRGAGVVSLDPGSYVLICNLKDTIDGEEVAHYSAGMYLGFTVEAGAAEE